MTTRSAYASGGLRRALHGLAAVLVLMCWMPALHAAGLTCNNIGVNTTLTHGQVDTLQRQLIGLGFDPGANDGLWGPDTRAGLEAFCRSVKYARNDDLLVMLRNHAAIHRAYRDWQATLASKGFRKWMLLQSDAMAINRVRQCGDSDKVIAVLRRYAGGKKSAGSRAGGGGAPSGTASGIASEMASGVTPVGRPARRPIVSPVVLPAGEAGFVSYVLTKADFKQLKSNEELADLIARLSAKPYPYKAAFKAQAGAALKGVPDAELYIDELAGYGAQRMVYSLGDKSFDTLKAQGVPDYVLQALAGIKDLDYTAGGLAGAVDKVLSGLTAKVLAMEPALVQFAQITPSGARMTADSLTAIGKAYPDDPLAAAVVKKLTPIQDVAYKDNTTLTWVVKVKLQSLVRQIDAAKPLALAAAVEVSQFVIGKEGADRVEKEVRQTIVPEDELKLISGLQDVDYPAEGLFRDAVVARIELDKSVNASNKAVIDPIDRLKATKVDDKLQAKWKKAKLPASILDRLLAMQGESFASTRALKNAVNASLEGLAKNYRRYLPQIVAQARKRHAYTPKAIDWDGDGYGCVSRVLAGEVYGLYPYWMAGKKQIIDFGVQSRAEYFGLRLDNRGGIAGHRQWTQDMDGQSFIREARTYCSKADLVVYRTDWGDWDRIGKVNRKMFFTRAAGNIAALVGQPMIDPLSRAIPYLTLGAERAPVMGDGVTLYLPGYPTDDESVAEFEHFMQQLSSSLARQGRHYALNLMLDSEDLGKGIYAYTRLRDLIREVERGGMLEARFLILLHAPTTRDKKMVRRHIENGLRGEDRINLLRHVAMIIVPGGESTQQLQNDAIYAKDNFGGIGFWTQPLMPAAKPLVKALQDYYWKAGAAKPGGIESAVCRIVCPHRWLFRMAWGLFALILLASIPLYLQVCRLRSAFDKYFIYFIACTVIPFVLISFALLNCDPALEAVSRGNGILILVITGIIAYSIWSYRAGKRRAKLP